jgi:NDP-sugar pyrophosphorylase family protein
MRRAVIFAGGRGTRLAPYTTVLPKPLIPIGEHSILELIVGQLVTHGITELTFCVGYLAHLIEAVFDSRPSQGCTITYVHEESPLGTAAPLNLVSGLDDTFLAMNGDILTTLDYSELIAAHQNAGHVMTIATHQRRSKLDYGILHIETVEPSLHKVVGFDEKPETMLTVSMGIYVLEPRALDFIPADGQFDIPDLVRALLDAGEAVGAFPFEGFWLDLGRHEDYEAAISWEKDRHLLIRQGLLA